MSKVSFRLVSVSLLVVVLLFGGAAGAFAQEGLVQCEGSSAAPGACGFCDIFTTIHNIFDFLVLQVTAPLATLLIIIGGLILMFGGGNPTLLNRGKAILKGSLIGLLIVLLSWIVVNSAINVITGSDSPSGFPWPWHTPACSSSGIGDPQSVGGGGGGGSVTQR